MAFQKRINLDGFRFGRLVVIKPAHKRKGKLYWLCVCDCGTQKSVIGSSLRKGDTKSCGCLVKETAAKTQTTHGLRYHALYNVWRGIIKRCYNPHDKAFKYYGAKGVIMCQEWRDGIQPFYDWCMANGWRQGLEVDRFPNRKGNYEPANCRCATPKENGQNKDFIMNPVKAMTLRNLFKIGAFTKKELSEIYGIGMGNVYSILNNKTWVNI